MMYMSEKAMSPKTKLFRYLALAGNLLLLGWVVAWQMTLSPHPHLDNVTLAIVWAVPLLLPLPGILAEYIFLRSLKKVQIQVHNWLELHISKY